MSLSLHREYYNTLSNMIKLGRRYSPARPWPKPNDALLCIYGWVKRCDDDKDWIEITPNGRFIFENATVSV